MKDYEEKVLNIMDNAKDNIRTQLDKAYESGYEDAKSELGKNAINLAHEERDRAYQRGLNDAWEAAKKIALDDGIPMHDLAQIFGMASFSRILKENTASEAIAKFKEYEEKQKQDAEQEQDIIKVGDEVYSDDLRFIVTRIITTKHMDITVKRYGGICTDGACYDNLPNDICKTGRTFPQIAEVLEKMRGESE